MKLSNLGLAFLAFVEDFRAVAYPDQGGVWTCGFGHTGKDVTRGTVCTPMQAHAWLATDSQHAQDVVNKHVTVVITQHQFDALVSFTFNLGESRLDTSTLLALTNAGQPIQASAEFAKWDHIGAQVNAGLDRRRAFECAFYLDGLPQA